MRSDDVKEEFVGEREADARFVDEKVEEVEKHVVIEVCQRLTWMLGLEEVHEWNAGAGDKLAAVENIFSEERKIEGTGCTIYGDRHQATVEFAQKSESISDYPMCH